MSDWDDLLKTHVSKQTKAKDRLEKKASRCFYGNKCKLRNTLQCRYAHGDEKDASNCLCQAWWCNKAHPNRNYYGMPKESAIATSKPPSGYVCKRCSSSDHYVANCPLNICVYCQQKGHIATQCPERVAYWHRGEKRKRE